MNRGKEHTNHQRRVKSTKRPRSKGLLEVTRERIRMRHLARFTEKQYIAWIRQFVLYHGKRHPRGMGEREIEEFLTYLAAQRNVAPATQNQALNAIVFLFRHVLGQKLGTFKNVTWAKRRMHIPVVLTRDETVAVLCAFRRGSHQKLIAHLLYGCGLRLTEALNLRIKDVDFGQGIIIVRDAKGGKDRTVPLPKLLERPLRRQIGHAKCVHAQDVREGYGRVSMPYALQRKYPNADSATQWQYVFPSVQRSRDPVSGDIKRHHLYDSIMEEALAKAVRQCGLDKRVTCHTFRHSYATHLLESGKDIRMIQTLLGHSDVKTTMIYTHVAKDRAPKCESPLDLLPLPPAEKQSEAESETEATLVAGEAPSETSQCSRDQHVSPGCGGVPGCSSGASTALPPLLPQPGRADRAIEVGRWHRFTAWLRSTINRR